MGSRMLFLYIFRQHVLLTGLVLVLLTFIVATVQFAESSRFRGDDGWDALGALQRILLETPAFLQSMLPYVVLVATAILVYRMGRQYELAIFSQIGRPWRRVLLPLVAGGAALGLVYTLLLNPLASYSSTRDAGGNAGVADSTEMEEGREVVLRDAEGFHFLLIDAIDADATALRGVTYLRLDNEHRLLNRVSAPRAAWLDGELVFTEARDLGTGTGGPLVEDGQLRLAFPQTVLQHRDRDRLTISVYELPSVISATRLVGASPWGLQARFQSLIALPALLGAVAFLAGALVYHPVIRGQWRKDVMAVLGAAFVMYFFLTFSEAMSSSGAAPAAVLAWGLPVLTALAGIGVLSVRSKRR
ncbi:MAG: LptF/LptG family permease [Paracoccaceae bacterium]|nr:LptF/LptG family permease [Paracoccaceae bacterium]